jgi:methylglutaconyl-CoA hydratase
MPGYLLNELARAIHRAGLDPDVKVIVLRSSGEKVFCAGASFEELASIQSEEQGKKFFSGFANVINAMRKCNKIIIGRIQGQCEGGGVGIASAVDYCVAVEAADIKLSELSIAIGPFVIGPAVEKIGLSAFSQLAIDASNWRNSEWAKRKGLFAEVHPTIEEMDESIQKLALSLVIPVQAMLELKKISWKSAENWDTLLIERAALSGRMVMSAASKEAISRVKQKLSRFLALLFLLWRSFAVLREKFRLSLHQLLLLFL